METTEPKRMVPTDDTRAYRQALGRFPTGVAVITCADDDELAGLTINSFSSVSLDPPLVLWSADKGSRSLALFRKATAFAVNILAADQMAISNRFARSGGEKFANLAWTPGLEGAPLLTGVSASFECLREAEHDAGDHVVIFGRVASYRNFARSPLLFALGRYGVTLDHPDVVDSSLRNEAPAHSTHELMLGLIRQALDHYSAAFEADRAKEGLSVNEGRVLFNVLRHPQISPAETAQESFLSVEKAEETLAALQSLGFVSVVGGRYSVRTPGEAKLDALRKRALEFDRALFVDVPDEEIRIVRNFLKRIVQRTSPKA